MCVYPFRTRNHWSIAIPRGSTPTTRSTSRMDVSRDFLQCQRDMLSLKRIKPFRRHGKACLLSFFNFLQCSCRVPVLKLHPTSRHRLAVCHPARLLHCALLLHTAKTFPSSESSELQPLFGDLHAFPREIYSSLSLSSI